jgi:hypothetical protein
VPQFIAVARLKNPMTAAPTIAIRRAGSRSVGATLE